MSINKSAFTSRSHLKAPHIDTTNNMSRNYLNDNHYFSVCESNFKQVCIFKTDSKISRDDAFLISVVNLFHKVCVGGGDCNTKRNITI